MKKTVGIAVLAFLLMSSTQTAPGGVSISDIKVLVTTNPVAENESVDSDHQQRLDSVKDVKKQLTKSVQLVDSEKDADVILKVLTSSQDTVFVLLTSGDYQATFLGSTFPTLPFGKWSTAGNDVIGQIKKWMKQNHDQLIARRSKQSS